MKSIIVSLLLMLMFASVAVCADEVPFIMPVDKDGVQRVEVPGKAIAFTPAKVGSYPFYCDKKPWFLASHRKKGMEGVLEVVE